LATRKNGEKRKKTVNTSQKKLVVKAQGRSGELTLKVAPEKNKRAGYERKAAFLRETEKKGPRRSWEKKKGGVGG